MGGSSDMGRVGTFTGKVNVIGAIMSIVLVLVLIPVLLELVLYIH